jgi:hypothetical protein
MGTPSGNDTLISPIFSYLSPFYALLVTADFNFVFWVLRVPSCEQKDSAAADEFGSAFGLARRVWSSLKPR